MSFGKALVAWAADEPDIVALVGDRVQPNETAQDMPRPYVTYQKVSGSPLGALDGPSGLINETWQISIVADTYSEVEELGLLFRGTRGNIKLDGYSGTIGDVEIRSIRCEDERDVNIPPSHGEGVSLCERQQDYAVSIDEAAT